MPQHCPGHPEIPCDNKTSKCRVYGIVRETKTCTCHIHACTHAHTKFLNAYVSFKEKFCIAFGPGKDMFDSTKIIGERQFEKGKVKTVH